MCPNYQDELLQSYVKDWWIEDNEKNICRGRLLWAYTLHIDMIPMELVAESRPSDDPTDHSRALISGKQLRMSAQRSRNTGVLPVAGLPPYDGEVYRIDRAKCRPAIIVSCGGDSVHRGLVGGKSAKWLTNPAILVAPYYGVGKNNHRSGWDDGLIKRIKCCEYPQYFYDYLPQKNGEESVLRLDHIQAIGNHHESYDLMPYRLSDEALDIFDELLDWLITGIVDVESILENFRQQRINEGS
jgi:hypothetical protein